MNKNKTSKGVMDGTKTTTNWIIAGLVALAIIIGGGWLIARERSGGVAQTATSTDSTMATNTDSGTTVAGKTVSVIPDRTASAMGETITVLDQKAGTYVVVADVALSKPSWIVIRDTRGWALGAAWFSESQKSIVVPLLKNTEAGKSYEAVIFTDDGDKKFTLHAGDMLVTSTQGAPVSSTFTAK